MNNNRRRPDGIDPVARSRSRRRALQAVYAWQLSGANERDIIGHIELDRFNLAAFGFDFRPGRVELFLTASANHHLRATACQKIRSSKADTVAAAGNDGDSPFKLLTHRTSSPPNFDKFGHISRVGRRIDPADGAMSGCTILQNA